LVSTSNYSTADMAADIIELMDKLHIEEAVIAGHSMGGYIALEIARNFPKHVSGLVLISSHVFADPLEKKQSRFEDIDRIMREGAAAVLENMPNILTYDDKVKSTCREAVIKMDSIGAMGALHAMANRDSSEDIWKRLDVSTMVIAGADDQLIPIEKVQRFALIPKYSSLVEVNNTGHMPMLEAPGEVAGALAKFVKNNQRNQ